MVFNAVSFFRSFSLLTHDADSCVVCSNEVRYAGRLADNDNECNMPCGGDAE